MHPYLHTPSGSMNWDNADVIRLRHLFTTWLCSARKVQSAIFVKGRGRSNPGKLLHMHCCMLCEPLQVLAKDVTFATFRLPIKTYGNLHGSRTDPTRATCVHPGVHLCNATLRLPMQSLHHLFARPPATFSVCLIGRGVARMRCFSQHPCQTTSTHGC